LKGICRPSETPVESSDATAAAVVVIFIYAHTSEFKYYTLGGVPGSCRPMRLVRLFRGFVGNTPTIAVAPRRGRPPHLLDNFSIRKSRTNLGGGSERDLACEHLLQYPLQFPPITCRLRSFPARLHSSSGRTVHLGRFHLAGLTISC